jgi:tetratricopeptide (TPR) repeat protein
MTQRHRAREMQNALDYYDEKLENYPYRSRYNHMKASILSEQGNIKDADYFYRQALVNAPSDVMVKNDYAVHMVTNYSDRKDDALKELKKALILVNENSVLHQNMGAVLGRKGDFRKALDHTQQASFLAPNNALIHRNIARLESTLGDTHTALKHNLESIAIDESKYHQFGIAPNTSAYRAAAVQIISKGGNHDEAHDLIKRARLLEKKKVVLSTSARTEEIINKITAKQAEQMRKLEEQRRAEEEAKRKSMAAWEAMLNDMTR